MEPHWNISFCSVSKTFFHLLSHHHKVIYLEWAHAISGVAAIWSDTGPEKSLVPLWQKHSQRWRQLSSSTVTARRNFPATNSKLRPGCNSRVLHRSSGTMQSSFERTLKFNSNKKVSLLFNVLLIDSEERHEITSSAIIISIEGH